MKKSQTMSVEAYIAVVVFMLAIIVFFVAANMKSKPKIENEAEDIAQSVSNQPMFQDGEMTEVEIGELANMDCDTLKQTLKTDKNVCIYFRNANGDVIMLDNKFSVGCPGLNISGIPCGEIISDS